MMAHVPRVHPRSRSSAGRGRQRGSPMGRDRWKRRSWRPTAWKREKDATRLKDGRDVRCMHACAPGRRRDARAGARGRGASERERAFGRLSRARRLSLASTDGGRWREEGTSRWRRTRMTRPCFGPCSRRRCTTRPSSGRTWDSCVISTRCDAMRGDGTTRVRGWRDSRGDERANGRGERRETTRGKRRVRG